MIPFYSKCNQVYPSLRGGRAAIEKYFSDRTDWLRECEMYAALTGKLTIPAVLAEESKLLITEYCPHKTFLSLLEQQENTGFRSLPWQELARWLSKCHAISGKLPTDGDLRNFLWNAQDEKVVGVDLGSYQSCELSAGSAVLIAALLMYGPQNSTVRHQAAEVIKKYLQVSEQQVLKAGEEIEKRRNSQKIPPSSGIILAGGRSRRMGRDKADIPLMGKTLLQWQIEKMRSMGIDDIIISGAAKIPQTDIRVVSDEYPSRGPLGGLHACLKAANYERCMVLSVDAPLVPVNALLHLQRMHTKGVTLLRHFQGQEPLIAVYDKIVFEDIAAMIEQGSAPVHALQEIVPWHFFDYLGPQELVCNCNTPDELSAAEALVERYRKQGLPL